MGLERLLLLLCAAAAAFAAAVLGRFLAWLLAQCVRDADRLARFCWPCWRRQLLLRLAISVASLRLALEILALAALLRRATSSANILSPQLSSIAVAGQRPLLGLELGHLGTGPCSNQGVPWPWISWSVLGTDPSEKPNQVA